MMRTSTDYIIVHCSATPPDMDIGVAEIRNWHTAKGWRDVGYHYVITRRGKVQVGRSYNAVGAHAKGFNNSSVGICLVGGVDSQGEPDANFTRAQYKELETLIYTLKDTYPRAAVLGHRDLPGVDKACPCFDVAPWWNDR